ncbi:toll/interleukin-1 receptor domain-containing protein [Sphingomonas sp. BT-65]|uniref:toll/interleukin-1 receptor domain-containing protein n=1 Tax=Sphingomonas sp. BT-65 TaxID=2989821 RepID=UPI002235D6A2|nr:toll/interleukin-1 receptor domain-containing protein [Sphingomonas sp. BT-65]MCW4463237.1 toll/interleukin-1 receptor domain-containing protein [Sphingomonas sp. BT-65]
MIQRRARADFEAAVDAFISYSHRDAAALDRLHVHLAVLRRDGLIDAWFDRDILAGDNLDQEIAERLEASGLFLLLVTPDFLNSDYCVEKEMARAMARQAAGEARVIAIIAEPCDWQSTNLRNIKVVPQDGRAVSEWTNPNSAYLNVVQEIRRAIESDQRPTELIPRGAEPPISPDAQRRYRAKRDFDDIDRSEFRQTAFNQMRDYFRSAVNELDSLDNFRARYSELSATSFGCTIVNRARDRGTAHLTVHTRKGGRSGFGDVYWLFEENAPDDGAHGWLSIEHDEFELYLQSNAFRMGRGDDRSRMTPMQAAQMLWENLLEKAGISYD